jgi:hypothetical protein
MLFQVITTPLCKSPQGFIGEFAQSRKSAGDGDENVVAILQELLSNLV